MVFLKKGPDSRAEGRGIFRAKDLGQRFKDRGLLFLAPGSLFLGPCPFLFFLLEILHEPIKHPGQLPGFLNPFIALFLFNIANVHPNINLCPQFPA